MSRPLRIVRWGALLLTGLMPLHAFLSVWAGHLFGHQALWQAWKEVVLAAMAAAAAIALARQPALLTKLRHPLIYVLAAYTAVSLAVTLLARPPLTAAVFGIKTDLEFLLAFTLALLASDRRFAGRLARVLLISSGIVIAFGLTQAYVLPADFLTAFGYGPSTVAPYQTLDPALNSVRIISTLGGPNQLGSFLILPLTLVLWKLLRQPKWWHLVYLAAGLAVLWHTYSRSAWLGVLAAFAFTFLAALPANRRLPVLLALTIAAAVGLNGLVGLSGSSKLQYYLFHQSITDTGIKGSTDLHSESFRAGIKEAAQHPWGEGLGAAGPASFRGGQPFIPESYYLQVAIESGLLGLGLFLAAQVLLVARLANQGRGGLGPPLVGALIGIGVINLFLHGWADSSTALAFWTCAGAVIGGKT